MESDHHALIIHRRLIMPAYMIALEVIHNREEFDTYRSLVHDVLDAYEAEVIVSNEDVEVLEGDWPYTKSVVIRFPSVEQAKAWYDSPEYQKIVGYRHRAATTDLILVEGRS
jgi:uncharacterized protein (DUF1330 family)